MRVAMGDPLINLIGLRVLGVGEGENQGVSL
jgi:hypothetical protein